MAKGFDRIDHFALRTKVHTSPSVRRQLQAWLKAGVLDDGQLCPTEEGTMQGGNISPLLAHMAWHGLETVLVATFPRSGSRGFNAPNVMRYADDFALLHEDREVVKPCQDVSAEWLKEIGVALQPSKTRLTHRLSAPHGTPGFDCRSFHIRQYSVGKTKSGKDCRGRLHGCKTRIKPSKAAIQRHVQKLRETVDSQKHADQETLIGKLNPVIIGWTQFYAHVVSARVFQSLGHMLYARLCAWAVYRHPHKKKRWTTSTYGRVDDGKGWTFQPPHGGPRLYRHDHTPIRRHVKVQGSRSPYDGDWVYWSSRFGCHPDVSARVARLLKRQRGRCWQCKLFFHDGNAMEVDHIIPKARGGMEAINNLPLLHRHCHAVKTARDRGQHGTYDKRQGVEEPDERKRSCPVLEPSRGGDIST
jgi:RNA-directed DNA polymerase